MGSRTAPNEGMHVNTRNVMNVDSNHITLFSDDETQDLRVNFNLPQFAINSENEFEEQPPTAKRAKKDNKGKTKNTKK